jgi:hypothetical protein
LTAWPLSSQPTSAGAPGLAEAAGSPARPAVCRRGDAAVRTAGSFAYWTDPIVDYDTGLAGKPVGDHTTTMIGANGKNPPGAPGALHPRGL